MNFPFLRISLFVAFALILSSLTAQSNFPLFQPLQDLELSREIKPTIGQFDLLTVDENLLQSIARDKPASFTLQIPFEGTTLSIDLKYYDVLGDEFKLFAGNEKSKKPVAYNGGAYYRGQLAGIDNALVAISFFDDEIIGVIADGRGNINIGLLLDSGPNNGLTAIAYRERFHTDLPEFECDANTDNVTADNKPKPSLTKSSMQMNFCFDTYLEGDFQLYQERQSSVANATNFITGMWNVVAALYDVEQLTADISEIFIWTSNDPYTNNNNGAALSDFRERMGNTGFNGDLAHLVSRGNSLGGVAYVDVVCSNFTETKTGVSTVASSYNQLPNYSWSINVLTHEIGHNLGSPHTHDCAWNGNNSPIDGCGYQFNNDDGCPGPIPNQGTIMSYCHLIGGVGVDFSLGFGIQPGNLIRGIVADCSDCSGPSNVPGCTDPNAHNYDSDANQDDGSCQTCFDGIRNGDETSIDCGGVRCEPCFECADNVGSVYLNNEQVETDICAGENANLVFNFGNANNPPYSFTYSDGISNFTINNIFPNNSGNYFFNVSPSVTTGYSIVSMEDSEGCEFEEFENQAAFLNVLEIPSPDAPQNIETCESSATFPPITGISGGLNSFYRRVGVNQTFQPGQTTTVSGDYLQIVDNNGCVSELSFTITIGGPDCDPCLDNVGNLTLQFGDIENDICSGESATLVFNFGNQGAAPFTLVYNDDNQNITVNNVNPTNNGNYTLIVSPNVTTAYNLISMTDSDGCEFENFTNQTVFVNVIPQPTPDAPQHIETCEESATFPAITGIGGGTTSYYRLVGSNQNFQPGQTTSTSGTYLQIVEINDCSSELSFTITIGGPDCTTDGCTDPDAHNYNPDATEDDGRCETCEDDIQNGDETGIDCGGILCGPCAGDTIRLIGNIHLESGQRLANIPVQVTMGGDTTSYQTDSIGDFKVANVLLDSNYLLQPISPTNDTTTNNASSGINILDVIELQRYLLGLSEPDALSPYQLIAADADENQLVSVSDIITSIQVILGIRDSFPGGRNWIFVDEDYVFPDPLNPWSEVYPEFRIVESLERDSLNNDFIAIKLGNVTGSVQQNLDMELTSSIDVNLENASFRSGNTVQLKGSFDYIAGDDELCYFEVSYNQQSLIYRGNLLINDRKPLVVDDREPGLLKVFWNSRNGVTHNAELVIDFTAKRNGELSSVVNSNSTGYWVDQAGTPSLINFTFANEPSLANSFLNESIVFPNPSRGRIQVGLTKGFSGNAIMVTLYDLHGKQASMQSITPPQGATEFPINLGKLTSGVYLLKLSIDQEVKAFRVVIE